MANDVRVRVKTQRQWGEELKKEIKDLSGANMGDYHLRELEGVEGDYWVPEGKLKELLESDLFVSMEFVVVEEEKIFATVFQDGESCGLLDGWRGSPDTFYGFVLRAILDFVPDKSLDIRKNLHPRWTYYSSREEEIQMNNVRYWALKEKKGVLRAMENDIKEFKMDFESFTTERKKKTILVIISNNFEAWIPPFLELGCKVIQIHTHNPKSSRINHPNLTIIDWKDLCKPNLITGSLGEIKITLLKANWDEIQAHAIANPTNETLSLDPSLCSILNPLGIPRTSEPGRAVLVPVKENQKLSSLTNYLIHLVSSSFSNEMSEIAIEDCLMEADELDISVVAFPLRGGTLGDCFEGKLEGKEGAKYLRWGIRTWLCNRDSQIANVKEIIIFDPEKECLEMAKKELMGGSVYRWGKMGFSLSDFSPKSMDLIWEAFERNENEVLWVPQGEECFEVDLGKNIYRDCAGRLYQLRKEKWTPFEF